MITGRHVGPRSSMCSERVKVGEAFLTFQRTRKSELNEEGWVFAMNPIIPKGRRAEAYPGKEKPPQKSKRSLHQTSVWHPVHALMRTRPRPTRVPCAPLRLRPSAAACSSLISSRGDRQPRAIVMICCPLPFQRATCQLRSPPP
ncbi:hypothetical protein C2845_PM15G18980 [Panicum miliaceum]|uniref:Uncharacterized protein n=1 Tax=Panicum miliaceum TaxID=4540 RepID=A0A3L6Q5F3_PANMI|nr:hypothetical protein C2845_PM15G18980 [Panicum miliaceum]